MIASRTSAEGMGATEVIPDDGPIALPAFVAVRREASDAALDVVRYLMSDDYLTPLAEFASFIVNSATVDTSLSVERLVTRPWDSLLEGAPDDEVARLSRIVRGGGGA